MRTCPTRTRIPFPVRRMSVYRFFELDGDGKIRGIPAELDCASDDDALALVRTLLQCGSSNALQVWLADRLIAQINASDLRKL